MSKMITYPKVPKDVPYTVFTAVNRDAAERIFSSKTGASWLGSRWFRTPQGEVSLTCRQDSDNVYLAHFQKFRKKVSRTGDLIPKIVNDEMVLSEASTVVNYAHWKVTVYKFPISRVISAKQLGRRFEVVLVN